jgi:ribosomal protein S18 acetylase RimI-like enzyme
MKIIKADQTNLDVVYGIIHECSLWLQKKGMDHWMGYYTEELIRHKFDTGEIFLLKEEGKFVGTMSASSQEPYYYSENKDGDNGMPINHTLKFTPGKAWYVSALAVLPEFQGRGLAKGLLLYIENYAKEKGIEFLRMDARGDYTDLINMYLRWGFKKIGSMPDPDSEYFLMEKSIK